MKQRITAKMVQNAALDLCGCIVAVCDARHGKIKAGQPARTIKITLERLIRALRGFGHSPTVTILGFQYLIKDEGVMLVDPDHKIRRKAGSLELIDYLAKHRRTPVEITITCGPEWDPQAEDEESE